MIFWFTGQPHAGKTTLAKHLYKFLSENSIKKTFLVDGDDLRKINNNKDYTEQGRRNNIAQAIAIAKYLDSLNYNVIVALVSPYKDMRDEFKEFIGNDIVEIYVHTNRKRQREQFKVENYQAPEEKFFDVDTTSESPIQSFTRLIHYLRETEKI